MFSTIFPPQIGGPATQCYHLCLALKDKGHNPVVLTYGASFTINKNNGFTVYTYKSKYFWGPIDRIIRWVLFPVYFFYILRKEKIQVLHCHSVNALSFVAGFVAMIYGIPRVIKFAGDWVWETISTKGVVAKDYKEIYNQSFLSKILTLIEKFGLKLFNLIWVVSEFRIENIKYLLGENARTILIPNCLLLEGGGYKIKNENDEVVVISASRFIPHKRLPWLVEAFSKIDNPNAKLVLMGGGDSKEIEKVKQKIIILNLGNRVELTGVLPFPELYRRLQGASFYVSSSLEEGLPNVFIEALNFGLPIVSTDAGGSKEIVEDGKTGFIVGLNDVAMLADKINLLATNFNLRNQFAKSAFESADKYNLKLSIDKFIDMYQGLINQYEK